MPFIRLAVPGLGQSEWGIALFQKAMRKPHLPNGWWMLMRLKPAVSNKSLNTHNNWVLTTPG